MGVLCGHESDSLSESAYDAIHALNLVVIQTAPFTRERFPHVAAYGGHKGWDS